MTKRRQLGGVAIAVSAMVWAVATCAAQSTPASNPAPCTVAPQPDPCGTQPAGSTSKPAAAKFPFPGETAPASDAPSLSGVPDAPASPEATTPAPPAAKKAFPFPGETPKPDASRGTGSSSSSSSDDDSSPIDPGASPDNSGGAPSGDKSQPTTGRHLLHRVNPVATKLQTADEREQEDLSVAHYYTQTGDLQAAYLRSQDAVKTAPDDPDAHFALAQVAQKLNKRDEAIAEYKACLKLDASDKEVKESHKALEKLQP